MTENIEEEHAAVESESSPARLSVIGGAVGTVVGLRRSKTAAVMGGLLGGAIGYVAGTASQGQAGGSYDGADEPVVVTVDDSDSEDDADATEATTEEPESDASEEQGDED